MEINLKYSPLDTLSNDDIASLLLSENIEDTIKLPLLVGYNHPNWKFAQDLCIKLSSHTDWRVRANSLRGLEYIAKTRGNLEKHLVKPVLIAALKSSDCDKLDAIHVTNKINKYLNWKIGTKAIARATNKS